MAECGIEVSEEELMEMQQQFQPERSALDEQQTQLEQFAGHPDASMDEDVDQVKPMMTAMDLIVTFGAPKRDDGSPDSKNDAQRAVTK